VSELTDVEATTVEAFICQDIMIEGKIAGNNDVAGIKIRK